MQSVMKHDFSRAPSIDAPRSMFDRSFGHKTAFDADYLIPFMIDDVLPGDTFTCDTTGFARLSTPEFPLLDNMYMDTHFFFVPLRLVWANARKFFGEQDDPADSIDFQLPQFSSYTPALGDLSDYLGLPPGNAMAPVSIYHRGYNLIWNSWFRDQNLQDSVVVDTDDGPDTDTDYVLLRRGKRHDYFTSALPWPQKGDAVTMPLGSTVPVIGDGGGTYPIEFRAADTPTTDRTLQLDTSGNVKLNYTPGALTNVYGSQGSQTGLYGDLTNATASTVNDLREAFQVQKLLERDARGGTRYPELVKNHFGVTFYDISVRPEFLGGGSTPINITPVAQTALDPVGTNTPIGRLAGYGTAGFSGHGFTKSFVEHGFIMGLVSVRADLTYSQGIPRHFRKSTRYDMYWPSLAHLGEQVIENAEIFYTNTATDEDVFGYQERYAEYRYKASQLSGLMRVDAAGTLSAWHLSQDFGSLPTLGSSFIESNTPVDRIIATPSEPHFIFDSYTKFRCARPMPMYGRPGMIDHF